jgi:predicted PurR-regulated permease PerM
MASPDDRPHAFRDAVVTIAGIGVILALLRMSASIVEPILLSLLIVAIASPGLKAMRRLGISTGVSVVAGRPRLSADPLARHPDGAGAGGGGR